MYHPFHCWTLFSPSCFSPTLGLYPGVLAVLDIPGYSRKDEKGQLFPVPVIPVLMPEMACFRFKVDDSGTFPVLHLLSKPLIWAA